MFTYMSLTVWTIVAVSVLAKSLVVHETLDRLPRGWAVGGIPSPNDTIILEIALKLSNVDAMVEALYAVSTPGGSQYGHHWSREQVDALVQPDGEAFNAVFGWLQDSDIDARTMTTTSKSVKFQATVSQANRLLYTEFLHYQHSGATKLRTTRYSVHEKVSRHVDFIHPTVFFGGPMKEKAKLERITNNVERDVDSDCSQGLTPVCLRELYNIPADYLPYDNVGASVAFGSFLGQTAQGADSLLYAQQYGFVNQSFSVFTINQGPNNQSNAYPVQNITEANMDAQLLAAVSHPLPLIEYITGGEPPIVPNVDEPSGYNMNEPYLEYYTYLLSLTNDELPQVISQSYGDDEDTVPQAYAVRVCNLIAMLGLRGITVIHSSGDTGVGAACRANTGAQEVQFTPTFPATCYAVTSVGGTQNANASTEEAWPGSSGGFSNYFSRPTYQNATITNYLNNQVSASTKVYYSAFTNFSGRAYPDLAALSAGPGYLIYLHGVESREGGTSAAAPVIAGIIALLNDARFKAGKSALGWLNPMIYSSGHTALRDITSGQSIGCNGKNTQTGQTVKGGGIIPGAHWNATEGWDAVTGFGVPDFGKMLQSWVAI